MSYPHESGYSDPHDFPCSLCDTAHGEHDEACERWHCRDCKTDKPDEHDKDCPAIEPYDYDDHALDEGGK